MVLPVRGSQSLLHATGKCVGSILFVVYSSKMFELVENRLYAYADDSTFLAVVRKRADRPAVAASVNRDLARIQEWCIHWCMILIPTKTKALVVSRSRTANIPHGDLVLSAWSFHFASPNLDILGVKFYSKITFEDRVHGIASPVSKRLRLVKHVFEDTVVASLPLCICLGKSISLGKPNPSVWENPQAHVLVGLRKQFINNFGFLT